MRYYCYKPDPVGCYRLQEHITLIDLAKCCINDSTVDEVWDGRHDMSCRKVDGKWTQRSTIIPSSEYWLKEDTKFLKRFKAALCKARKSLEPTV